MKKILYIALSLLLTLGIAGCNEQCQCYGRKPSPLDSTLLYVCMGLCLYAWRHHWRFDESDLNDFLQRKTIRLGSLSKFHYYILPKLVHWSGM